MSMYLSFRRGGTIDHQECTSKHVAAQTIIVAIAAHGGVA